MVDSPNFIADSLTILIPLALILSGIFAAQVYFYLLDYESDHVFLRTYVVFIWLAELLHSVFCMHLLYTYIATDFGNFQEVQHVTWSAAATILLQAVVVGLTQSYYLYRVWILCKKRWQIPTIPGIALLIRLGFNFATASFLYRFPEWLTLHDKSALKACHQYTVNVGFGLAILVDMSLAFLLIYELRKTQQNVQFHIPYIQQVVNHTIGTGVLTVQDIFPCRLNYGKPASGLPALSPSEQAPQFNAMATNLTYAGLIEILTKLYAITMLANLNARKYTRNTPPTPRLFESIELSSTGKRGNVTDRPLEILKHTTTITDRDDRDDRDAFAEEQENAKVVAIV
ncbi:hypothetical protein NM688_g844 [Phlebia brevispora]|uniref:Uncharacterized protein n=1 Tax=Phlebia brevispora TaxID=194682 RepID=A0ACC1TDE8_9APHY|nr:hypothetical protein NM688_g844 [Phlebia brevispora]